MAAAVIVVTLQPFVAAPAKADLIDFLRCWAKRDCTGHGRTFTAGCYALWSKTAPTPDVERALKDLQAGYMKDQEALRNRYIQKGEALLQTQKK